MILLLLIMLHTVDGHSVEINPSLVTSMNGPRGKSLFAEGGRCMVNLTDGKFVIVREDCPAVKRMIEDAK